MRTEHRHCTRNAHDGIDKGVCSMSTSDLTFIPADVSERESLIAFAIASHDTHETRTASLDVAREVLNIEEDQFNGRVVKAMLGDVVIGFYALKNSNTPNATELSHLFVHPSYLNKGYGTVIYHHVLTTVRTQGGSVLRFISDPDAINFYIKRGAKIIRRDEDLLNPDLSIAIMEHQIADCESY